MCYLINSIITTKISQPLPRKYYEMDVNLAYNTWRCANVGIAATRGIQLGQSVILHSDVLNFAYLHIFIIVVIVQVTVIIVMRGYAYIYLLTCGVVNYFFDFYFIPTTSRSIIYKLNFSVALIIDTRRRRRVRQLLPF